MSAQHGPRSGALNVARPVLGTVLALVAAAAGLWLAWRALTGATVSVEEPAGIRAFEERTTERLRETAPRARPLTGPIRIRVEDVVWDDAEGRPFVRADLISAVVDASALNRGDVAVETAELHDPELFLDKDPGGRWNFERVLAVFGNGRDEEADERDGTVVVVHDLLVRNGYISVRRPGADYRFLDVDARLPLVAFSTPDRPGPVVRVASLSARLVAPDANRRLPLALSDATIRFLRDGGLAFEAERARLGETVLASIEARRAERLPGLGIEAELRVEQVRFANLQFLLPALPAEGGGSFRLRIEPLGGGRTALRVRDLRLRSGPAEVSGALTVVLGPEGPTLDRVDLRVEQLDLALVERFTGPLPYGGRVSGQITGAGAGAIRFDLTAELTAPGVAEPFRTRLAGRIIRTADGFQIGRLEAELERVPLEALGAIAPGLPLEGVISGRVTLEGAPGAAPVTLDISFGLAGGRVLVHGTVDLTGPVPSYDVSGRVISIALARVFAIEVPPADLTARFSLIGRGIQPERATARLRARGGFSGWRALSANDTLAVRAAVDDGRLAIEELLLALGPIQLEAEGEWAFLAPAGGAIRYSLAIRRLEALEPYLPYVPAAELAGSLRAHGAITGTLEAPQLAGSFAADDLRYGEWSAGTIEARYTLESAEGLPLARLDLRAEAVETPGAATLASARVRLRIRPRLVALRFAADRADGGIIRLAADARLPASEERELVVREFVIDLGGERWRLVHPAEIRWGGIEGIGIDDLLVRAGEGPGRVAIDGRFPPTAEAGLRVRIAALPLGRILSLAGVESIPASGRLWARAELEGPADSPEIALEFRIRDGTFRELAFSAIEGLVRYRERRLRAEAMLTLRNGAPTQLRVSLPLSLTIGVPPSLALLDTGRIEGSLVATDVPVGVLASLTPWVTEAEGRIDARVEVGGTVNQPVLEGEAHLRGGAVTVPALGGERYEQITADLALENRRVVVRDLRIESDGVAIASGVIVFEELARPVADLSIRFDNFNAVEVEDYDDANVWGELAVRGPLRAPRISGEIRIDDGYLPIPGAGGAPAEFGLAVADLPETAGDFGGGELLPGVPAAEQRGVRLNDLEIRLGDELWFVSERARVQLHGRLSVNKAGEDLSITGELEGRRGTVTLRIGVFVREFEIVEAHVRFFGTPEPNPAIRITASRTIYGPQGGEIEILVRVGGTVNNPTVAFSTGAGAPIPESEILSFLIFGRPTFAVEEVGFRDLSVEAANITFAWVEEQIVQGTDVIDFFRIRPAPGPIAGLGAPTLIVGSRISEEIFVTFSRFGGAGDVEAAYGASLEWRIDRQWTIELARSPVNRERLYRYIGFFGPFREANRQQFTIDIIRRWTY